MRSSKALLAGAGVVGAGVAATGFPRRIGVTRSEAEISLPGDLLLPVADIQADRAHEFARTAKQLWPELLAVEDLYSHLWARPLLLQVEQPEKLLVWSTKPSPQSRSPEDWEATLTAALLPGTDGHTVVHLRERYKKTDGYKSGRLTQMVVASAFMAPATWFRFRRATK